LGYVIRNVLLKGEFTQIANVWLRGEIYYHQGIRGKYDFIIRECKNEL